MSAPESQFPTITDMRDALSELIDKGLGELPVQLLIVPDSTIQALAQSMGFSPNEKPALMIELEANGNRLPPSLISTDRFARGGMPTRKMQ